MTTRNVNVLQVLQKALKQTALTDKQAGYSLSAHDIMIEVHNTESSWADSISKLEDALLFALSAVCVIAGDATRACLLLFHFLWLVPKQFGEQ